MKLEIWQIKRSDKRDRCAVCLLPFRKGQFKLKSKEFRGYRFSNVCYKHKDE